MKTEDVRPRELHNGRQWHRYLELLCFEWNSEYPAGTPVKFYPISGDDKHRKTETEGFAYVLSGHTPVIKLKNVPGCVALENCEPDGTRPFPGTYWIWLDNEWKQGDWDGHYWQLPVDGIHDIRPAKVGIVGPRWTVPPRPAPPGGIPPAPQEEQ